jgi:hypothetical protein
MTYDLHHNEPAAGTGPGAISAPLLPLGTLLPQIYSFEHPADRAR